MELADKIREAAEKLSGSTDALYAHLSAVVAELMLAQLRKDVSAESCQAALIYGGAFMLLSFAQSLQQNELTGFDAGTLKLSFRERDDTFAQIAKQIMAPWCHDLTAFCGVKA